VANALCGELTGVQPSTEERRGLQKNDSWSSTYTPLHRNRRLEARKGVLTDEVLGRRETDNVEGENSG
jgi:hypothetical protein